MRTSAGHKRKASLRQNGFIRPSASTSEPLQRSHIQRIIRQSTFRAFSRQRALSRLEDGERRDSNENASSSLPKRTDVGSSDCNTQERSVTSISAAERKTLDPPSAVAGTHWPRCQTTRTMNPEFPIQHSLRAHVIVASRKCAPSPYSKTPRPLVTT